MLGHKGDNFSFRLLMKKADIAQTAGCHHLHARRDNV